MMTRLIPKLFYRRLEEGLDLFVRCLSFQVLHQDAALAVTERDDAKAYLVGGAEFAAKDRPEITIETNTIDELYREISTKAPELLHPSALQVEKKPWGAREFAVRDQTGVCVILRQWS